MSTETEKAIAKREERTRKLAAAAAKVKQPAKAEEAKK